ncbi:alkylmercury lyase [Mycolicibacterium chubuense]|uniref:Alkylmercury lyase n=1 Tax=Mycolicibacterium chubuense (strain NBB4) TaxID=710421 RepID=E7BQT4_MYCCN|nr:hypothetical protein [Mycolicibacterium chubuense NBB4]
MRIELLAAPGCPHAAAARQVITDCLTRLGLDLPIIDRVGRYSSPTVLINGVDVMRSGAAPPVGDACRLDLPTPQRVLDALRAHAADHDDPVPPDEFSAPAASRPRSGQPTRRPPRRIRPSAPASPGEE